MSISSFVMCFFLHETAGRMNLNREARGGWVEKATKSVFKVNFHLVIFPPVEHQVRVTHLRA